MKQSSMGKTKGSSPVQSAKKQINPCKLITYEGFLF